MSVKIYFILLSCLAYYAMSVPTETNKPNEDVTIPVVDSMEDSTTIAEQVKQEENPPTTTLQDDQLDVCWESFQKANEEGRKIPLKNILLFINYSKEYIENFDHVVEIMRQRGLMDSDMITFDDLTSCIEEFSNQTFAVLSSDVITALSDAVKKETDKSDGKITFKKLESVMEKMPENWALKEFKTYLLQNVFVDENRSISHEEFTEAMAVFNDLEIEQDDFEEYNTFAVLSSDVITALSDAVKKETDKGDGKITFKKLESVIETMTENLALTEFKTYLLQNVFVDENHSISHEEFREAMAEFNELEKEQDDFEEYNNSVLSGVVITALSDAVKKETDKGDGKITFKKLESVIETMTENLALTEFKTYLLQNVFVDENHSISHEEFREAMAEFNELEKEQDDFEEYNNSVLSGVVITALGDAVKKETDKGDGKITFKKLESVIETMTENLALTEFKTYLLQNVFVDENHSISHEEFREAMAEFNELEKEQAFAVLSSDVITALSDAVKKETDKSDGKITFKKLESVMEKMPENWALTEFKTYLLQNVFVDENRSISHEEFTEAMAVFNDLEIEQDDFEEYNDDLEENDNSVLSGLIITALSYAVKKETDRNDGKITFETLKSVMETMPPDLDLSAFEIYLKEKVFFNDYYLISHDEFTKAMAEFNKLEKQKIIFSRIDLDGNNKITADEIFKHMKKKGNFRSLENIEKTIKQYALEDKNCLNFDEFRQMMATKENRKFLNEEFDEMDLNNDGILSIDELRVGMEKLFGKVPEVQVQKTFRSLVVDTDGKVTKEGYVASDGI